MKMLGIGFLSFILMGCQVYSPKNTLIIDPEFQPYFEIWHQEAQKRGVPMNVKNLIMQFTDAYNNTNTLAQCFYGTSETSPVIQIGTAFWKYSDSGTREQVVFHELAHCILGRGHLDDSVHYMGAIIPKSVMSTNIFPTYYYDHYRNYYIDEIFLGR